MILVLSFQKTMTFFFLNSTERQIGIVDLGKKHFFIIKVKRNRLLWITLNFIYFRIGHFKSHKQIKMFLLVESDRAVISWHWIRHHKRKRTNKHKKRKKQQQQQNIKKKKNEKELSYIQRTDKGFFRTRGIFFWTEISFIEIMSRK